MPELNPSEKQAIEMADKLADAILGHSSCDTPADFMQASHHGWRTFRVAATLEAQPTEILCPSSNEAGNKTTCAKSGLCNGAGSAKNIFIPVHGSGKKNALQRRRKHKCDSHWNLILTHLKCSQQKTRCTCCAKQRTNCTGQTHGRTVRFLRTGLHLIAAQISHSLVRMSANGRSRKAATNACAREFPVSLQRLPARQSRRAYRTRGRRHRAGDQPAWVPARKHHASLPYWGVVLLNGAAAHCAMRHAAAIERQDMQGAIDWFDALLFCEEKADALDWQLVYGKAEVIQ